MKLYHMSQTLQLGNTLTPDCENHTELIQPFIQALEQSVDCFYGMVLNAKYMYVVLNRFKLREWSNYAKWATEAVFEFIRKTEYPNDYSRINCNYFYDSISNCKKLYDNNYGCESKEERNKVHLFEVEVADNCPQKRDMNIYDNAFDVMSETQDIKVVFDFARRYFCGEQTENPIWEVLSDKPAIAVTDVTSYLKNNIND